MSTQELDVKKSWRAVKRNRSVVLAVAGAGLLAGVVIGLLLGPMHTATSLVVLPARPVSVDNTAGTHSIETQVLIASSEPVLRSAGQNFDPPMTTTMLRDRVKVGAVTPDVIEVAAQAPSADEAMDLANTVAEVYLAYVSTETDLPGELSYRTGARMLERATTARSGELAAHLGLFGLLGAFAGGLVASLAILVIARGDRRLRLRQEIADSVGIPVVASVSTYRANEVSNWVNLLGRYKPTSVDAWSMRKMLHHLRLDARRGGPASLAVITFAGDDKALPLGPQLAAFATSIGIPAAVEVDPRNGQANGSPGGTEPNAGEGSVADGAEQPNDEAPAPRLMIWLTVVDRDAPQLAGIQPTTATIVGLAAGAVTAEELARLAVAAAGADRMIDGLVVGDPDPTDRTTGRVPLSGLRSGARLPTRLAAATRRSRS